MKNKLAPFYMSRQAHTNVMNMQMQTDRQTEFALGVHALSCSPACLSSSGGNAKECGNAATETDAHARKDG